MTQKMKLNQMPAPTWSWLRMNDATVEGLETFRPAPQNVKLSFDGCSFGKPGALDAALKNATGRYEHLRRKSAPGDTASRERAGEDPDATLDVPALSTYQQGAIELEENYSPDAAFKTGLGAETYRWMRHIAGPDSSLVVMPRQHASLFVEACGGHGLAAVAATDVIVADDAQLDLTILLDGESLKSTNNDGAQGVVGSSLRIFAGTNAQVSITCTNTASDDYIVLDDTGIFAETSAHIDVKHVVLGGSAAYTGFASELAGDTSTINVVTSYLGTAEQVRDFDYQIVHRGLRTTSELDANGVLAGSSTKTLRGTIDLAHGCKGSTGTEHETVLLADEKVKNKTIPVILCDEDDVAGNHGATIGHVRADQLFYLESRGVSPEAAEALFLRAKLEDAALSAPNETVRAAVCRLGGTLIDGFEEDLV